MTDDAKCEACGEVDCRDALPYEDVDLRALIKLMHRDSVASAVAHRWVAGATEIARLREEVARLQCEMDDAQAEAARLRALICSPAPLGPA